MPEGPEVRLSAALIFPLIKGKRMITAHAAPNSRYAHDPIIGLQYFLKEVSAGPVIVKDISTHGKFMYWSFDNDWYMYCTFGMTGQWSPTEGKHPCLEVFYEDDKEIKSLFFNDPRHFGTIKFVKGQNKLLDKISELGWDPFRDSYTDYEKWIKRTLSKSNKPIGQVLLDQNIFSGTGNYIRAEALYQAKVSPWRSCSSLSSSEIDLICESIKNVMHESYNYQGATIQTYKTAYGAEGKYSSQFKVYGKKIDPLGNKIKSETTPEGRTIHWCPALQV
jgi:formamidopyrimidine-DNA glycosylase